MRNAPLKTKNAISRPIIQSGIGLAVHATNIPAIMTPILAITSLAEKI